MDEANGNGNDTDDTDLHRPEVVNVDPHGDVVLDVLFEQSKEMLRAAKQSSTVRNQTVLHQAPTLRREVRVAYRVSSKQLIQQSGYFGRLLGDERFEEARSVRESRDKLVRRGCTPAEATASDLAWVRVEDDDEATRATGREAIFLDVLRMLHKQKPECMYTTGRQVAIAAVLADRFDCAGTLSVALKPYVRVKWAILPPKAVLLSPDDKQQLSLAAEENIRQQIYIFWVLNVSVPPRLSAASRALIMHGSSCWTASPTESEQDERRSGAIWWDLPADLEREHQFRRACILNTIASIPHHFLQLYASRERQCKLGYDSSKACDSYQLGEMMRFLLHKKLLFLVDFGPKSLDDALDAPLGRGMEIGHIIAALKQCPGYQIDKYHTNCGLRTRMLPILDYVQAMVSAPVVAVSKGAWERDRSATSWLLARERHLGLSSTDNDGKSRTFRFSRSLASDSRLRYEGHLALDRFARELFTADDWNWTPEE